MGHIWVFPKLGAPDWGPFIRGPYYGCIFGVPDFVNPHFAMHRFCPKP